MPDEPNNAVSAFSSNNVRIDRTDRTSWRGAAAACSTRAQRGLADKATSMENIP
jgi:hypothetical protein